MQLMHPQAAATTLQFTPEQVVELRALTDTPEEQAAFTAALNDSFGTVGAKVGFVADQTADTSTASSVDALAQGWDRDHWWVTMSYADASNGGITAAVWACGKKLPGWVCNGLGNVLRSWVNGWGWSQSHGVWASVYNTGRVTGGRW